MNKKWKVTAGILAALVLAGVLIALALQGTEVEVHRVSRGNIAASFTEDGRLISEDERGVYSSYRARIIEVAVEEGGQVNEGDLLVVLDEKDLDYQVQEIEARLRGIAAELEKLDDDIEQAIRDYFRILDVSYLRAQDVKEMRKDLETKQEVLRSERSALYTQLERLREHKADSRIYAPISGVVQQLQAEEGSMASPESPLLRLYEKGAREIEYLVETRVLTRDVLDIYEEMPVKIILERREQDLEFNGEIKEIYSYAVTEVSPLGLEEERVTVTVTPDLPDNLQLGLGYRVEVEFITEQQDDVLWVPQAALFNYQGKDALMIVVDNRARIEIVSTGMEANRQVVIEEGITEGDLVILNPETNDLDEGNRVYYTLPD